MLVICNLPSNISLVSCSIKLAESGHCGFWIADCGLLKEKKRAEGIEFESRNAEVGRKSKEDKKIRTED